MALIKSISGIRGTIGGDPGKSLTPVDIVHFASAFGTMVASGCEGRTPVMVVGRDARISGEMVSSLVCGTLTGLGIQVVNLELAATPTVEMAITHKRADGGIIITASHNPGNWNALKLLNDKGEFISAEEGARLLKIVGEMKYDFAPVSRLGRVIQDDSMNRVHIDKITELDMVNPERIRKAGFRVVVDCVNSVGGIVLPLLLKAIGVRDVLELYCEPTGIFPHDPEPLPGNLEAISAEVVKQHADVGFVVDPDVDRLAIVCEDGSMFGEEYTLVAVSDYVFRHRKGHAVSNLSSTWALRDVALQQGCTWSAAAVGEVNVVNEMKRTQAVIGGEGNGGVIYPGLHYGRDALVGIALFLSHLAVSGMSCSALRRSYPDYYNSKNKMVLERMEDVDGILAGIREKYSQEKINELDGIKIEFDTEWVHLRKSNTEPVIRVISESRSQERADSLAGQIMEDIGRLMRH